MLVHKGILVRKNNGFTGLPNWVGLVAYRAADQSARVYYVSLNGVTKGQIVGQEAVGYFLPGSATRIHSATMDFLGDNIIISYGAVNGDDSQVLVFDRLTGVQSYSSTLMNQFAPRAIDMNSEGDTYLQGEPLGGDGFGVLRTATYPFAGVQLETLLSSSVGDAGTTIQGAAFDKLDSNHAWTIISNQTAVKYDITTTLPILTYVHGGGSGVDGLATGWDGRVYAFFSATMTLSAYLNGVVQDNVNIAATIPVGDVVSDVFTWKTGVARPF